MPELQIEVTFSRDVAVLVLQGRITRGDGDFVLRSTLRDLLEKGRKKIVIDMKNVPYMDSTGLGEYVSGYTSAKRVHATIKLSNLAQRVQDMFGVVQLQSLFETFTSTDEAVMSFAS
jgi:anti-sigma B factor antagonist